MSPDSPLHQALCDALDDEYKARATYMAVIKAFGPVLPFAHIVHSEQDHIDALLTLLATRGLPAIADPYAAGLTAPSSIKEACRIGVEAEIENVALYDRLMPIAKDDADVTGLFRMLQQASAECHLPAFQRGLDGNLGAGCGGGAHHHHGGGEHGHCGCGGGSPRRWPLDTRIKGAGAPL